MEILKLFELFVQHSAELDLNRIDTALVVHNGNENMFLEKAKNLWDKEINGACMGGISTNYCVFVSGEGIIFFLSFSTFETHPEGPNNEPPGIQTDWNLNWCTKTSKMMSWADTLNKPYSFFTEWEKIKKEAEESLVAFKKVEYD